MVWAWGGISPLVRVGGCGGAFELSPTLPEIQGVVGKLPAW